MGLFSRKKRAAEGLASSEILLWFTAGQPRRLESLEGVRTTFSGDPPMLGHMPSAMLDFLLVFVGMAIDDEGATVNVQLERLSEITLKASEAGSLFGGVAPEVFCTVPMRFGDEVPTRPPDAEMTLKVQARPDIRSFVAKVDNPGGAAAFAPTAEEAAELFGAGFWALLADTARQAPRETLFFFAAQLNFQVGAMIDRPDLLGPSDTTGQAAWIGHERMHELKREVQKSI